MTSDAHGLRFLWKVPRSYRNVCNDCGGIIPMLTKLPPRLRVSRIRTTEDLTDMYVEPLCNKCWKKEQT